MAFIELRAELFEELHRPPLSAQAGNQLHRRGWVFDSERCMVRAHVRWAEPGASDRNKQRKIGRGAFVGDDGTKRWSRKGLHERISRVHDVLASIMIGFR